MASNGLGSRSENEPCVTPSGSHAPHRRADLLRSGGWRVRETALARCTNRRPWPSGGSAGRPACTQRRPGRLVGDVSAWSLARPGGQVTAGRPIEASVWPVVVDAAGFLVVTGARAMVGAGSRRRQGSPDRLRRRVAGRPMSRLAGRQRQLRRRGLHAVRCWRRSCREPGMASALRVRRRCGNWWGVTNQSVTHLPGRSGVLLHRSRHRVPKVTRPNNEWRP